MVRFYRGMVMGLLCAAPACGGGSGLNPLLVGTWEGPVPGAPGAFIQTLVLKADGTTTASLSDTGCTGSINSSGSSWSATSSTLEFSNTSVCSGSIMCGTSGQGLSCANFVEAPDNDCDYVLSDDDDTLTLTCSGTTSILKRQG